MIHYRTKNRRHIEDNFDLNEYKERFLKAKYEKNSSKNNLIIHGMTLAIIGFLVLLGLLLFQLGSYYIDLWQNDAIAKEASQMLNVPDLPLDGTSTLPVVTIPKEGEDEEETVVVKQQEIIPEVPKKEISKTFLELQQKYNNTDIVGYVKIDGTNINNIVMQSTDNEFYLTKDLYKKDNVAGSIFMDFENSVEDFSQNTIIYGHNMRNGSMFHNIRYYEDEYFYSTHKYIALSTLYENTKWEIFSFYDTPTSFNYLTTHFANDAEYKKFLDEIKSKSQYETGISVSPSDKILTLSTCTNAQEDTRWVIHAKLVEATPQSE